MTTVYKYDIKIRDVFELELPVGAKILTVQTQSGEPKLWAMVRTHLPSEVRRFRLCGTGHELDGRLNYEYVGTFQMQFDRLVFHLFEVKP